jgi:hypothetical protein
LIGCKSIYLINKFVKCIFIPEKIVRTTFRDQLNFGYKKTTGKELKTNNKMVELEQRMGIHTRSLKFALVGCVGDAKVH